MLVRIIIDGQVLASIQAADDGAFNLYDTRVARLESGGHNPVTNAMEFEYRTVPVHEPRMHIPDEEGIPYLTETEKRLAVTQRTGIPAIEEVRTRLGIGLKEAKDAVDKYMKRGRWNPWGDKWRWEYNEFPGKCISPKEVVDCGRGFEAGEMRWVYASSFYWVHDECMTMVHVKDAKDMHG